MILSISGADWLALSNAVKEIMYIIQLLVDNEGGIFVVSNITTTSCSKHFNTRYNDVNEYVKDGVVNIIFGQYVENDRHS